MRDALRIGFFWQNYFYDFSSQNTQKDLLFFSAKYCNANTFWKSKEMQYFAEILISNDLHFGVLFYSGKFSVAAVIMPVNVLFFFFETVHPISCFSFFSFISFYSIVSYLLLFYRSAMMSCISLRCVPTTMLQLCCHYNNNK